MCMKLLLMHSNIIIEHCYIQMISECKKYNHNHKHETYLNKHRNASSKSIPKAVQQV